MPYSIVTVDATVDDPVLEAQLMPGVGAAGFSHSGGRGLSQIKKHFFADLDYLKHDHDDMNYL